MRNLLGTSPKIPLRCRSSRGHSRLPPRDTSISLHLGAPGAKMARRGRSDTTGSRPTSGRATAGPDTTGSATDGSVSSVQRRGALSSIRAARMGRISKRTARVAGVTASIQAVAGSALHEFPQGSSTVETPAPPAPLTSSASPCLGRKIKKNEKALLTSELHCGHSCKIHAFSDMGSRGRAHFRRAAAAPTVGLCALVLLAGVRNRGV